MLDDYQYDEFMGEKAKVEEKYVLATARLTELHIEAHPDRKDNHVPHHQAVHIDIPPFNGKYEEWKSFEDLFLSAMAPQTTPTHKNIRNSSSYYEEMH